ncbi:MAG: hypothetical protein IPN42_17895 [Methylococcaceae bacterium]|nr:hypothetical protein [Methylococcaceae bacterium]
MAINIQRRNNSKSLSHQIKAAEQQVLYRQRNIGTTVSMITSKLQQQMTTPVSLLLASGIGFMLGEITKDRSPKGQNITSKTMPVEPSPLSIALKLVTSIQTIYTALPIVWIMKAFYQPTSSKQSAKRDFSR